MNSGLLFFMRAVLAICTRNVKTGRIYTCHKRVKIYVQQNNKKDGGCTEFCVSNVGGGWMYLSRAPWKPP
ncbi:MAG: hypothetical protein LBH70_03640, partial [Spirochaetaceae bacterium]|nr:hypothetical protein [Spirochaetaceae bacterium]